MQSQPLLRAGVERRYKNHPSNNGNAKGRDVRRKPWPDVTARSLRLQCAVGLFTPHSKTTRWGLSVAALVGLRTATIGIGVHFLGVVREGRIRNGSRTALRTPEARCL